MNWDEAKPIALEVWKDPQNFVITQHVRDEMWTYFRCWDSPGQKAGYLGCLHFEGVWHVDSSRFRETKSYPNVVETDLRSYYLIVENSSLLRSLNAKRSKADAGWEQYDHRQYKHYIVESHDFYTNIIADAVSFSIVKTEQAKPYLDIWEKV